VAGAAASSAAGRQGGRKFPRRPVAAAFRRSPNTRIWLKGRLNERSGTMTEPQPDRRWRRSPNSSHVAECRSRSSTGQADRGDERRYAIAGHDFRARHDPQLCKLCRSMRTAVVSGPARYPSPGPRSICASGQDLSRGEEIEPHLCLLLRRPGGGAVVAYEWRTNPPDTGEVVKITPKRRKRGGRGCRNAGTADAPPAPARRAAGAGGNGRCA